MNQGFVLIASIETDDRLLQWFLQENYPLAATYSHNRMASFRDLIYSNCLGTVKGIAVNDYLGSSKEERKGLPGR